MKMKSKILIAEFLILVMTILGIIGGTVIWVDPFFHYHKPDIDKFFYMLGNPRSQNDGICRQFDYNALITGTSMAENFMTTEADEIFGVNSIKVPYAGATYKEINDNLRRALKYNENLRLIIRGLDMERFVDEKDMMRNDMGRFPTYLYDDNYLNDVEYIFNRDVVFKEVYPMVITNQKNGVEPGIRSFDIYSNWMPANYSFGADAVLLNGANAAINVDETQTYLTKEEEKIVLDNIQQNVTSLAAEYPNVTFCYFFTPYSAAWWMHLVEDGDVYRQIEIERLVIEEILKYENIRLFSFNNKTNIITDLNNYKDDRHYGEWINSLMLRWIHDGEGLLTRDNYEKYLAQELSFYTSYDYQQLFQQVDYENDYFAAAILCKEINGTNSLSCSEALFKKGEIKSAEVFDNLYNGEAGIQCHGCIQRKPDSELSLEDYLFREEYIGCKATISDISDYNYLVFYGKKTSDEGQLGVYLYDIKGTFLKKYEKSYLDLDDEWHQYLINVSDLENEIVIIFNGGFVDNTGSKDMSYMFSDVVLY